MLFCIRVNATVVRIAFVYFLQLPTVFILPMTNQ
jgi:hypothetical protein